MRKTIIFMVWLLLLGGCKFGNKEKLFELLSSNETGIEFANTIPTDSQLNFVEYTYVYNGAGVGVGDFNNDGLQDIFFAGNVVSNKLYINEGDFKFTDVSKSAGIDTPNRWCTGVSLVDINADGLLDVYVCAADIDETKEGRNLLYINNGDLTFTEKAADYGIDDIGFSTQGAFFDYDKDGDLDLYLLTNAESNYSNSKPRNKVTDGTAKSNDQLYENTGIGADGHPVYKNVTEQAGIMIEGHGLGVAIADLNMDSWPDVYVANDFLTNDLVWINNGDGTFYNAASEYTKHQTHNGMGADVNDFNNDGLPDIYVLDMLPETNYRKKTMVGPMNYDGFMEFLDLGYEPQYLRNTLQLNMGRKPNGGMSFSEIGQLSGVQSTDWSWAPLFADFNHDGYKDLWVTNGYRKDVTDMDYIMRESQNPKFFGGQLDKEELKKIGEKLQSVKVSDYMYKNNGDLTFDDVTEEWGIKKPSFSNGAAFADFDNDGDLDLVVNNIDDPALVYKNNLNPGQESSENNFIRIKLKGPAQNLSGFGAKVILKVNDLKLYHDHSVYRGYKSTVENTIHFGVGDHMTIDTLKVFWLDGSSQWLTNVDVNQELTIDHAKAKVRYDDVEVPTSDSLIFNEAVEQPGLQYIHEEKDYVDYKYLPLLPHKFSQSGPGTAVGDINGDGLDDFVIGGSVRKPTKVFFQHQDGSFTHKKLPGDSIYEDMGLLLFDADGDGDLDLFAVSGSVEFYEGHPAYQDRLYINDGSGNFTYKPKALPEYLASGTVVTAADYNRDGDLDLFIGGSMVPRQYPDASRSLILKNDNGTFSDVTEEVAEGLSNIGIVNTALWTDFNHDGWMDLIVAGEWMPVTLYQNKAGKFVNVTSETGISEYTGWWNSIVGDDFDGDGDTDYIVGNYGLNNKFSPTPEEPLRAYVADFDNNSVQDAILTYYINGVEYPVHSRDGMIMQMNAFRGRFTDYASYADATFSEVFSEGQIARSSKYKATEFGTCYLENLGNHQFSIKRLPTQAQFAPVFGMRSGDFDGDGNTDILLVGNSYAVETVGGWQDALPGVYLRGDGKGGFEFVDMAKSGFVVESDAKAMAEIYVQGKPFIMVTSNRDSLKLFGTNNNKHKKLVDLRQGDAYATITTKGGEVYKKEFYFGSGYLSQSSRVFRIPGEAEKVGIVNYKGNKREVDLKSEPPLTELK